jgi:hypothetical protein
MRDAARQASSFIEGMTREEFLADERRNAAKNKLEM